MFYTYAHCSYTRPREKEVTQEEPQLSIELSGAMAAQRVYLLPVSNAVRHTWLLPTGGSCCVFVCDAGDPQLTQGWVNETNFVEVIGLVEA